MSLSLKKDSLFIKDSDGTYHSAAFYSSTLPDEIETLKNTIPPQYMNLAASIASGYSTSKSYNAGDYVFRNNALYECTASTSGSWDNSKWKVVPLGDAVAALNKGGLDIHEDFLAEEIANWLEEHPEATTTVQDESLTKDKLNSQLVFYLTPQMFGAVGDGSTDDSSAIQAAVNAAANTPGKTVFFTTNYYVSTTIEVPANVCLMRPSSLEYTNYIYVADDVVPVFNCSYGNHFRNLNIKPKSGNLYKPYVGFQMNGTARRDADSLFENVEISYAEVGIDIYGRNVQVVGGCLSHCRYGIRAQIPEDGGSGYRGMEFRKIRFHGVGEEYDTVNDPTKAMYELGTCADIFLDLDISRNDYIQISDVIIDSCLSDQGGPLVKGNAQFCTITNNVVKTFCSPAIVITKEKESTASNWLVDGNLFAGNRGVDIFGITRDLPECLMTVEHNYVTIVNNVFVGWTGSAIDFKNSNRVCVDGNSFSSLSGDYLISSTNSYLNVTNNMSRSINVVLGKRNSDGDKSYMYVCKNNSNIKNYGDMFTLDTNLINLGTVKSGSEDAFPYLNYRKLLLRRTDSTTLFTLTIYNNAYATSSVHFISEGFLEWLSIDLSTYRLQLNRYNLSTNALTKLSVDLIVYLEI